MADNRTNLWTFIVYPNDSLPENYLNIINNWHLPCLLSPIHNADKEGEPTEQFKEHIHIMVYFGQGAKKSFEQVKELSDQLKGCNPFPVLCRNALVRYFIHKDNPEKQQGYKDKNNKTILWTENDLIKLGGFEVGDSFCGYDDVNSIYNTLEMIIIDNCIFNFANLVQYLRKHNLNYELQFLRKNTIYINALLTGYWQKLRYIKKVDVD